MNHKLMLALGAALLACALLGSYFLVGSSRAGKGSQSPNAQRLVSVLTDLVEETPRPIADDVKTPAAAEAENPWKNEPAREPAVAGKFYPGDRTALTGMIQGFLDKAAGERIERLRGLVCPHAGYEYSGQTAAFSYKQAQGRNYRTVIVMAPSHHSLFEGAYIAPVSGYKTPLGVAPLSSLAATLAGKAPFSSKPPFRMARAVGAARPDQFEHSLEVQIPFLQHILKDFKLVPIVFGEVEPAAVAKALLPFLDEQTLVIASTDLSHFHTDEEARALDSACIKAICNLDAESLSKQEACGRAPILALVELARQKGWKTQLLDSRNSSAVTGDKSNVVGYSAIGFFEKGGAAMGSSTADVKDATKNTAAADGAGNQFSASERQWMLKLARNTLNEVVNRRNMPEVAEKEAPEKLRENGACFVTLTIGGDLRGCIGHIVAIEPLYKAVADNARSAALEDYRFNPVQPEELKKIHIEISVLTKPEPLAFNGPEDLLKKLQVNKDGVVLKVGGRGATFLPQVWEKLPDKVDFLNHLSQKAGMPAAAWREPGTQVSIYHVEAFEEEKN